jgi:prolyl 4-hydroxylase
MFFNFLNDAEITYILSKAEGLFRPSLTGVASAAVMDAATTNRTALLEERTSLTRTSYSCVLDPDDPVVINISERVAYLAGFPPSHVERLSVIRYEPGQFFKEHHDGQFRPKTVGLSSRLPTLLSFSISQFSYSSCRGFSVKHIPFILER